MSGCNGIGCEGCDGGRGNRDFPTHATTPTSDGGGATKSDSGVSVKGGFNNCPTVSVQAAPVMVRVGQSLMVMANASDIDPDDMNLMYTWTTTSGYFGENGEPQAKFTCTDPGPATLTVTVTDGSCPVTAQIAVFCVAIRDAGGDAGTSGSGTGMGGAGGSVGGAGGSGPVNTCPAAEPTRGGADCAKCTTDNCTLGADGTDGCCGLASAADQLLCQALYACISANATTCTKAGDATPCFCGTSMSNCFAVAGAANGPCVKEVQAAAKSVDPVLIKMRLISPMFPLGRTINLAACQGGLCGTECAFPQM